MTGTCASECIHVRQFDAYSLALLTVCQYHDFDM
jgi:hypothetical protein